MTRGTQHNANRRRKDIFDAGGSICLVGLVVFVTVLGAELFLHPALGPRDHRISEYVNASGGWLMVFGFAGWTSALAAAALLALRRGVGPARVAVAAGIALAALGIVVITVFPTQTSAGRLPDGAELTWTGRAHDLGSATAFLALTFAAAVGA